MRKKAKHGGRGKEKRSRALESSADQLRAPASGAPPIQRRRRERAVGLRDLNFYVSEKFHRRFKVTAASWRVSMKTLLEEMFDEWLTKHGAEPPLTAHERRFLGGDFGSPAETDGRRGEHEK